MHFCSMMSDSDTTLRYEQRSKIATSTADRYVVIYIYPNLHQYATVTFLVTVLLTIGICFRIALLSHHHLLLASSVN